MNMTTLSTNGNLQIIDVLENASKYDEVATHTLKNGEDMQFFPYFSHTKLTEIVNEFHALVENMNEDDEKIYKIISEDVISSTLFWNFLAVKKFTHFGEFMKEETSLSGLAPYYNALLETGLLSEITEEVFLFEELRKLNDTFATVNASYRAALNFMNTHEEKLKVAQDNLRQTMMKVQ